jgi:hypothetical protein
VRARVLGHVRQPLLHDAVDDDLLVLVERVQRARLERELGVDARAPAELGHERAQRGGEPEVVERGRAQLAREPQQLLHRLRGDALRLGELGAQLLGRALGGRLQPQQHARERLVGLVVEVARDARALGLLGLEDRAGGARALGVDALEHPVERLAQARDLLHLAALGRRGRAPAGEVDGLHRGDELLERREAPAQHQAVDEDGREQRAGEQREAPPVGHRAGVEVHHERRREDGRGDQHRVDGEDLGQECGTLHGRSGHRHRVAPTVAPLPPLDR